tara:strand:+ start:5144 stop:6937 length:1794 start_codon:yes stop_codon:yes gene_type:complete
MAGILPVSYYNSFLLKKTGCTVNQSATNVADSIWTPIWPGIFWSPYKSGTFPINAAIQPSDIKNRNWYIEEARIKGGYNNTSVAFGVKAYLNEENPIQLNRFNAIIYSGVFNSLTGFNQTNVFSTSKSITTSLDPSNGSIQKMYAADTNLIVCQENKISKVLIDKDITYTSENGTKTLPAGVVLGQTVPFAGDYGISKNPESFASFGFRRYFTDRFRGKVLRLSQDGLSVISENGMTDFFRDQSELISDEFKRVILPFFGRADPSLNNSLDIVGLGSFTGLEYGMTIFIPPIGTIEPTLNTGATIIEFDENNGTMKLSQPLPSFVTVGMPSPMAALKYVKDRIVGSYDVRDSKYTVSYQIEGIDPLNDTEKFTFANEPLVIENTSTLSFDEKVKGWTSYYTYRPNIIFSAKSDFYSFKNGSLWKHYDETSNNNRGRFYGVRNPSSVIFIINEQPSLKKVFQTVNYEGDNGFEVNYFNSDFQRVDKVANTNNFGNSYQDLASGGNSSPTIAVYSYDQGFYTDTTTLQPKRAGFDRKENLYVANLINSSVVRPGEIIFGNSISGIKGYFATVKISTDNYTDVGGLKELWSVGSRYVRSS